MRHVVKTEHPHMKGRTLRPERLNQYESARQISAVAVGAEMAHLSEPVSVQKFGAKPSPQSVLQPFRQEAPGYHREWPTTTFS